jgi:hypothetical protein
LRFVLVPAPAIQPKLSGRISRTARRPYAARD